MWRFRKRTADAGTHDRALFNIGDLPMTNTAAGVSVTADTAPKLSAVWRCLTLLCDTISTLPIDVYRAGTKEPLDKPQILLQPCSDATFDEWVWMLLWEALTSPAAWGLIAARSGAALRPTQIEPLPRGRVVVAVEPDHRRGGTRTVYRLDGQEIDRDDLWRFRLCPAAGAVGLDPIRFAAEIIGAGLAAQQYGSTFYRDSAIPSMALVTEQPLTQTQAQGLRDIWELSHKGRRGTAVMGNGLKPVPLTVDPEKAMLIESQRFTIQQVARYFGIPPELIGADAGNPKTYSNQESRDLDLLKYSVGSKIAKLETALNGLMPRAQYVKLNTGALLRTDTKTRMETHEIAIRSGLSTINERRALEDLEPVSWGDRPAAVTAGPPNLEAVS
jgi:HK97 family phage portal protein